MGYTSRKIIAASARRNDSIPRNVEAAILEIMRLFENAAKRIGEL